MKGLREHRAGGIDALAKHVAVGGGAVAVGEGEVSRRAGVGHQAQVSSESVHVD